MSKIVWDASGERVYETGVKNGVLFPKNGVDGAYAAGVAWNGLTAVTESPSGAESTSLYADDQKYLTLVSAEEFGATVEAYTYPDEFAICDGSATEGTGVSAGAISIGQQNRIPFGLVYTTTVGNDAAGQNAGYKIHIIYGATASPSQKAYSTINDSPEAITFSWELSTTPVNVTGHKATASLVIDSTKAAAADMTALETILYGTNTQGETQGADPRLPLPDEIITLFTHAQ